MKRPLNASGSCVPFGLMKCWVVSRSVADSARSDARNAPPTVGRRSSDSAENSGPSASELDDPNTAARSALRRPRFFSSQLCAVYCTCPA